MKNKRKQVYQGRSLVWLRCPVRGSKKDPCHLARGQLLGFGGLAWHRASAAADFASAVMIWTATVLPCAAGTSLLIASIDSRGTVMVRMAVMVWPVG